MISFPRRVFYGYIFISIFAGIRHSSAFVQPQASNMMRGLRRSVFGGTSVLCAAAFSAKKGALGTGDRPSMSQPLSATATRSEPEAVTWSKKVAGRKEKIENIVKPSLDEKSYRWMQLDNGMMVFLIHDPSTEKSACSVSVNVGYKADPRELSGLAHFCEHMLFLGSEAFPVENTYREYLSKYRGRSNAGTGAEFTTYYLDVGSAYLKGALDIFSQFFVSPLFTESATDRELHAVDSEDSKNRINDDRRMLQVMKAVSSKNHYYSKFSTGNIKTLLVEDLDTREELKRFHAAHYYAGNMGLAIYGRESLDDLEAWARECFDKIKADPVAPPPGVVSIGASEAVAGQSAAKISQQAATAVEQGVEDSVIKQLVDASLWSPFNEKPTTITMEPVSHQRRLHVMWPVPPTRAMWKASPLRLIQYLWASEAPGSPAQVLRERGLVNAFSGSVRMASDDFGIFQVAVDLSEEGEEKSAEVLDVIHQYAKLVSTISDEEANRLWKEMSLMSETNFKFSPQPQPISLVQAVSQRLHLYPPESLLSAGSVVSSEPPLALVRAFLPYFVPENTITWRVSKDALEKVPKDGLRTEKWYGVPFQATPMPASTLEHWRTSSVDPALSIPPANEYIPSDFTLAGSMGGIKPAPGTIHPVNLLDTGVNDESLLGHLWQRTDDIFGQPRAYVKLSIVSPAAHEVFAPEDKVSLSLMMLLLNKKLKHVTKAAALAGLGWGVSGTRYGNGLELTVNGYNEKLPLLMETVLSGILAVPEYTDDEIFRAKDQLMRAYRGSKLERGDVLASGYRDRIVTKQTDVDDLIAALDKTTLATMQSFHKRLWEQVHPVCIVHGNAAVLGAQELWKTCLEKLKAKGAQPVPEEEYPTLNVRLLPKGRKSLLRVGVTNAEDENSSVLWYCQLGLLTPLEEETLGILARIVNEPCFTELRTKQQLGYVVNSGHSSEGKLKGFEIRVLSKTHHPEDISERVATFVDSIKSIVEDMPTEKYDQHIKSAIQAYTEPIRTLSSENARICREVDSNEYEWEAGAKRAALIPQVTKQDVLAMLTKYMLPGPDRRCLEVMVYGCNSPMPDATHVSDEEEPLELRAGTIEQFGASLETVRASKEPHQAVRDYSSSCQPVLKSKL